jgi:hypothetical protein
MPNKNESLIAKCNALIDEIALLKPQNGHTAVAIGGLHTTREHLGYHGAVEEKPAAPAPETAQK